MKRRIRRGLAPALVVVTILLVGGAPAPAQPPSNENHFRCYIVSQQTPQPAETITLQDQFTTAPETVTVGEPVMVCAPTAKTVGEQIFPIEDEEEHFVLYNAPGVASPRDVLVTDQFGADVAWHVTTPKYVLVPTAKTVGGQIFDDRRDLNHYWCYEANGPRVGVRATLDDQFSGPDDIRVTTPTLLCNRAEKVHDGERFRIEEKAVAPRLLRDPRQAGDRAVHHRSGESVRDGRVPDRGLGDPVRPGREGVAEFLGTRSATRTLRRGRSETGRLRPPRLPNTRLSGTCDHVLR
jgi:hypothetical protein